MPETIEVHVPEGFPPMSRPVDPKERIPANKIELSRITEDDLTDVATGLAASFPEVWWERHDPMAKRPPHDVRIARMAKRLHPWVWLPGNHGIKASDAETGEFMGFAGWVGPGRPQILVNTFRHDTVEKMNIKEREGWTDEDVAEMWANINIESWQGEFCGYDKVREEELGNKDHWYLAPFFVVEKFRGRGIGHHLLKYAMDRADAHDPPLECYLEALPNARPVYLHCGFESMDHKGTGRESVMIRPAKKN